MPTEIADAEGLRSNWIAMLIALATEGKKTGPGRAYFIASGDNRQYASHRGRPALQAMERRGFVKQHIPGFGDGKPASMIRAGEDSMYSITEEGGKKLAALGYDLERCQAIRKEWGR